MILRNGDSCAASRGNEITLSIFVLFYIKYMIKYLNTHISTLLEWPFVEPDTQPNLIASWQIPPTGHCRSLEGAPPPVWPGNSRSVSHRCRNPRTPPDKPMRIFPLPALKLTATLYTWMRNAIPAISFFLLVAHESLFLKITSYFRRVGIEKRTRKSTRAKLGFWREWSGGKRVGNFW